ncbi:MAG: hypothetical protein K2J51_01260, partial [Alistipes sp.]|nr:hypothetical protein [Alistipes sp.]
MSSIGRATILPQGGLCGGECRHSIRGTGGTAIRHLTSKKITFVNFLQKAAPNALEGRFYGIRTAVTDCVYVFWSVFFGGGDLQIRIFGIIF